jgi:hypothetical protein
MYRALLAFLVFASVGLSLATVALIMASNEAQQIPEEIKKHPAKHMLGGAQDYSKQQEDVPVSFSVRVATHIVGIVAGSVALYFLYAKKFKGTKLMLLPFLTSATALGLYAYNEYTLVSNVFIFKQIDQNLTTVGANKDDKSHIYRNMLIDISASAVGILAQLGTIVYLFNRRV